MTTLDRPSSGARTPGPGAGSTIRTDLTVIRQVFRYARQRMGMAALPNPVELLEDAGRPKRDGKTKRALTDVELGKLLAAAASERDRLLFEVGAETAGRIGEVLGLVWPDINLEDGTIRFRLQVQDGERVGLKSKAAYRTVEIRTALAAKLKRAKLAAAPGVDLVFTAHGKPLDDGNVNVALGRAAKRAGLEPITYGWLRHAHASRLIHEGWEVVEVSGRLGHSEAATTLRHYVHEFRDARASAERRGRLPRMATEMATSERNHPQRPERGAERDVPSLSAISAIGDKAQRSATSRF